MLCQPVLYVRRSPALLLFSRRRCSYSTQSKAPELSISSPARIRKLIASQRDPLLAKEIYDLSSSIIPPTPSHLQILILKLARAGRFSLSLSLLRRLPSPPSLSLLSSLSLTFSRLSRPDLALTALRLLPPHILPPRLLRGLLNALSSQPSYLPAALSLLRSHPDLPSQNLLLRFLCRARRLSIAIPLFHRLQLHGLSPDASSYRFLIQGLCRRAQLSSALSLFEEMLNRGLTPDSLTCTTVLNALCRKKQLREAFKLICRMRLWGCAPDLVHFNTLIIGFCREGRPLYACKLFEEMHANGVVPDLLSYTSLVNGLCAPGDLDKANEYLVEMVAKGLVPHFSVYHALVRGFCNAGKDEEGCRIVEAMLRKGVVPHVETWMYVVAAACENYSGDVLDGIIMKMAREDEWRRSTRMLRWRVLVAVLMTTTGSQLRASVAFSFNQLQVLATVTVLPTVAKFSRQCFSYCYPLAGDLQIYQCLIISTTLGTSVGNITVNRHTNFRSSHLLQRSYGNI